MSVARKDMPLDKEESGGGFERILLILVPAIFTIVLLGRSPYFSEPMSGMGFEVANKIPVVKNWVPDPVLTPEEQKLKEAKQQEESAEATIVELKKQLAEKEETLSEVTEQKQRRKTR